METEKKFIIIDGNSVVHRAYHALPDLTDKNGEAVGAIYGFILALFKIVKDFEPDYLAACFDTPKPTFRHLEFKEYKAKRPATPENLKSQLGRVRSLLGDLDVAFFEKEGFEADDLLATIIKKTREEAAGRELMVYVLTGDRDSLQLVNERTKMYILNRGVKNSFIYDREKILNDYGIEPEQVVALKALAGDTSDNIPGVPGIGEKGALELLKKYKTLRNIYECAENEPANFLDGSKAKSAKIRDLLLANKEKVFFFEKMVRMRDDAPIDYCLKKCFFTDFDKLKTETALAKLGFMSLVKRIPFKTHLVIQTLFKI
ncbi:MAG TPA: 5'-3' exonuclease H3TH domain-containing protein [Candidatus Paceibacterota bacterium]|nr:5'-3' exonuclease H3TH domain-containing protein [Candidatus Pacearchaeota archaeon]HRZ51183.1 5'-3' exonuclease H3TH domain-containing protein [Candidatus Paceibacterota bacterium]HSA36904.1 5'-3' exonuclease H3TH domain-containing protein [Candidatus Paceibacterota bacterium]